MCSVSGAPACLLKQMRRTIQLEAVDSVLQVAPDMALNDCKHTIPCQSRLGEADLTTSVISDPLAREKDR